MDQGQKNLKAEAGLLEDLNRVDQDINVICKRVHDLLDSLQRTEQKTDEE